MLSKRDVANEMGYLVLQEAKAMFKDDPPEQRRAIYVKTRRRSQSPLRRENFGRRHVRSSNKTRAIQIEFDQHRRPSATTSRQGILA